MVRLSLAACALIAVMALAPAAFAHPAPGAAPAPSGATTKNLQGDNNQAWVDNPHMHRFYDLSVATLGKGARKPDIAAYTEKSYAIFREFGVSMGGNAAAMQDHLKLIPGQVVQIAKEDPSVLDSYDNFMVALMGPK